MNTDPLDDIFTSDSEIDPQLLAEILKSYVKINTDTNMIFYTDDGLELPLIDKITLFFVARKALKYKGKIEDEGISPSEIVKQTSLKEGSVHPTLKNLRKQGWIISKDGKYFLPSHQLNKIKNHFVQKTH
ncbi:MAG: helix-turn-helix domain-containing protein [bacterium]